MYIYLTILLVFYVIIAAVVAAFVVWNLFRAKKITDKLICAIVLIMFILRIFLIK